MWGELSPECGASCLEASFLWGELSWGELSLGRVVLIPTDDPLGAAITLNSDLSRIHRWASQWLVTFNPSKSESLLFSRKINRPYHPPLTMNYQQVTEVTNHKHLGLYFSSKGTWHEHIEYI